MRTAHADSLRFSLLVLLLGFGCYFWVLDNGFMSDDLVMLDQSRSLIHLSAQLHSAPASFRLTTFAWFAALQKVFGLQPVAFYVLSIALHCLNALLLRHVLIRRGTAPQLAALTALLFLVIQNPSEAVGWLSAVNELLVGFFVLGVLWAAHASCYRVCLVLYVGALLSKESGAVAVLLLPLLALTQVRRSDGQKPPVWFWIAVGALTAGYIAWFASLVQTNFLIQSRFYSLNWSSVLVLAFTLHKLAFPWLYLALGVGALTTGGALRALRGDPRNDPERRATLQELAVAVLWILVALLPYVFLVYDIHLPSRHLYLASMPAAYLVAQLVGRIRKRWLRDGFVILFILSNAGYLWLVKDNQYSQRGATTRELISILRRSRPGCVVVRDFPENPWIAKLSARFVPGWSSNMIKVNEAADSSGCLVVRWNREHRRYEFLSRPGDEL